MGKSAWQAGAVGGSFFEVLERGARPADGAAHGLIRGFVTRRIFEALVERHHDVAAERELDVDRGFGREHVRVAIQMRAEEHAFFRDFAQIAEAEDLEAARVRQDRARPGHEVVQPAEVADQFVAGAEEEVIGIGQDDFGVELVRRGGEIALHDALDAWLACRLA